MTNRLYRATGAMMEGHEMAKRLTTAELNSLSTLVWIGHEFGPDVFDDPQRFGVAQTQVPAGSPLVDLARRIVSHLPQGVAQ
jgi:hypothetical protein